jgi:hypothetical protein
MPTHNSHLPEGHKNEEVDASLGYEPTDVKSTGIIVFLVAMGIFVVVTAVTCYGIGKVINAHLNREDGPNSKWTQTVDVRQLGNLPSNPALQNKVAEITQSFPTPRVQLGRSVEGQSKNSDRAGDGDHCAARAAGGSRGPDAAADGRRQPSGGDGSADQRLCPHHV